jgi:hypothetical protein
MSLLDNFDFSFGKGQKKTISRRGDPKEYVSKLTGKRSREYNNNEDNKPTNKKNGAPRNIKGRLKMFVMRYISVISSDINVFCSYFKPRVKVVYKEKILYKDISELTIEDLYE